jgi:hypothetical protein
MEFPTKSEFKAWLESKPAQASVGLSCRLNCCPIASCLNEHGANGKAYVRPDALYTESCWRVSDDGSDRHALPRWANLFAIHVDRRAIGVDVDIHDVPVSAQEALDILADVVFDDDASEYHDIA